MNTVVIVDDHMLIAKAITSIINDFDGFQVLYEVENGKRLTEKFKSEQNIPDIVLLDISMPVMDGYETAEWLQKNHPSVKVMALTMNGDEASLVKIIRNGAKGYLQKNIHPMELHNGLTRLAETGYYFPDWATTQLVRNITSGNETNSGQIDISPREKEFLKYACTELTYKEIAELMFCSPRTVESYRDSLFEKLHIKARVALALYSVKIGLYSVDS